MTTLEFSLELSDRLAREAREAGLLAPEALAELIENGVRRKAAERIRTARSTPGGEAPMTLEDLQAIVKTVRAGKPCNELVNKIRNFGQPRACSSIMKVPG